MKSLSVPKYNNYRHLNNSFSTPDKKTNKSRQNTQSTLKFSGEMMSVQSYLYEQAHLKEEDQKKQLIRQIRNVIDNLEKSKNFKQLNQQLSNLIIGLKTSQQEEVSNQIIQLIQIIRDIVNNQQNNKQIDYNKDQAILIQKIHELELQAKENQYQQDLQIQNIQAQERIKNYEIQLKQIIQSKEQYQQIQPQKQQINNHEKIQIKNQIKLMQQKIETLSEKEKKLIQLVKAVKLRGIDIEHIYKNINQVSSRNSIITNQENEQQYFLDSSYSDFADISQFDIGQSSIKRNHKFLLD